MKPTCARMHVCRAKIKRILQLQLFKLHIEKNINYKKPSSESKCVFVCSYLCLILKALITADPDFLLGSVDFMIYKIKTSITHTLGGYTDQWKENFYEVREINNLVLVTIATDRFIFASRESTSALSLFTSFIISLSHLCSKCFIDLSIILQRRNACLMSQL